MQRSNQKLVQEFIDLAQFAAGNPHLSQAGGGNISVKDKNHEIILIKSSGIPLSKIQKESGYLQLPMASLEELIQSELFKNLNALSQQNLFSRAMDLIANFSGKPSIETAMHVLLGRVVLHLHPVSVNAMTCLKSGRKLLQKLFQDAIYVSYALPGYPLARAIQNEIEKHKSRSPKVIFLENHGLIVSGESVSEVTHTTEKVILKIQKLIGQIPMEINEEVFKIWPLTPDEVVYCGKKPVLGRTSKSQKEILLAHLQIVHLGRKFGRFQTLSSRHISDILNMESEKYRQKVAR